MDNEATIISPTAGSRRYNPALLPLLFLAFLFALVDPNHTHTFVMWIACFALGEISFMRRGYSFWFGFKKILVPASIALMIGVVIGAMLGGIQFAFEQMFADIFSSFTPG